MPMPMGGGLFSLSGQKAVSKIAKNVVFCILCMSMGEARAPPPPPFKDVEAPISESVSLPRLSLPNFYLNFFILKIFWHKKIFNDI